MNKQLSGNSGQLLPKQVLDTPSLVEQRFLESIKDFEKNFQLPSQKK